VNSWRSTVPALIAASAVVIACGTGTTAPSRSPPNAQPVREDTPPSDALEPPGPWAPSRALQLDRFALETALGVALVGPAGAEFGSATRWTLAGRDTELRLDVRTGFSGAEAEVQCRALAGDRAVQSLSLGTPVWNAANDVYLTRGASCIRVRVTRSGRADPAGAAAVAGALVRAD
jgi:hypothetical protein